MSSARRPLRTGRLGTLCLFGLPGLLALFGLYCLAACGSLPTIVPDLARRAGPPVQLEGARGPLTPAQSKAVLDRLSSLGPDTGIFERHLAREEALVGSPLTTGNQVTQTENEETGIGRKEVMPHDVTAGVKQEWVRRYAKKGHEDWGQGFAKLLRDRKAGGEHSLVVCCEEAVAQIPPGHRPVAGWTAGSRCRVRGRFESDHHRLFRVSCDWC